MRGSQRNYTLTKRKIKNGFNYQINIYENGNLLKRLSSHTNNKDIADKYARDLLFSDNHGKDFYTELESNSSVQSLIKLATINNDLFQKALKTIASATNTTIIFADTQNNVNSYEYIKDFYDYDKSPYKQYKKLKTGKLPNHAFFKNSYCTLKSIFEYAQKNLNKGSKELTCNDINNLNIYLSQLKLANNSLHQLQSIINTILKFMYKNDLTNTDLSKYLIITPLKDTEKNILTKSQINQLLTSNWNNKQVKLICLTACLTGMRINEILALRKCDIFNDCIIVSHSLSRIDGLKSTKNGKSRKVFICNELSKLLLDNIPTDSSINDFIFTTSYNIVRKNLNKQLKKMNLPKITMHSFRHFYCTYNNNINGLELTRQLVGHSSLSMTSHYTNHETLENDNKLKQASIQYNNELNLMEVLHE